MLITWTNLLAISPISYLETGIARPLEHALNPSELFSVDVQRDLDLRDQSWHSVLG